MMLWFGASLARLVAPVRAASLFAVNAPLLPAARAATGAFPGAPDPCVDWLAELEQEATSRPEPAHAAAVRIRPRNGPEVLPAGVLTRPAGMPLRRAGAGREAPRGGRGA